MKVLHILKSPPDEEIKKIIELQSRTGEIKVVDINNISHEDLIDMIFESDKVISW
jgi:hypothetical protein